MNLSGIPAPQMDWNASNLIEEWTKFTEHCELISKGPLKDQGEDVHVTMLLLYMGAKGRDIFRAANVTNEEKKKTKKIFEKIRQHIAPRVNPVFSRFQFNNLVQGEKTIEQFLTLVKNKADECDFGDKKSDMIRDRIVFGVSSPKIREKLLQVGAELKMDRAIEVCQQFEYAREQLKVFDQSIPAPVHNSPFHSSLFLENCYLTFYLLLTALTLNWTG